MVGIGIAQAPCLADCTVGAFRCGGEAHLGTVGAQNLAPLFRYGLAHDNLDGIALDDSDDGEGYAGVA